MHTEMFVDSLVDLYEAGKVTGAHKTMNRYQMAYCFAAGSSRMYKFLDRNPRVLRRAGRLHQPAASHHAERQRGRDLSTPRRSISSGRRARSRRGCGRSAAPAGSLQFIRGAYASRGGKAFLCLASTYERGASAPSRIVARIDESNVVTTPRTDVMYVVTEYGIANLKGKSIRERARALIALAHPDFREQLERDALPLRNTRALDFLKPLARRDAAAPASYLLATPISERSWSVRPAEHRAA